MSHSQFSNKVTACRRMADTLAKAARAMGLAADIEESRVSASHYVYVELPDEEENIDNASATIKVRVSDHDEKHGRSDVYAWVRDHGSTALWDVIFQIAQRAERPVPDYYTREAFERRSARSRAAAAKRKEASAQREVQMARSVQDPLTARKCRSYHVAIRICRILFPDALPAQRRRAAAMAADWVARDDAIAAALATNDIESLALLATRYGKAKHILHCLVGEEKFLRLRPAGCSRKAWATFEDGHSCAFCDEGLHPRMDLVGREAASVQDEPRRPVVQP